MSANLKYAFFSHDPVSIKFSTRIPWDSPHTKVSYWTFEKKMNLNNLQNFETFEKFEN